MTAPRLTPSLLETLSLKLNYTPEDHKVGCVHIGLGAFHRGHQAIYFDHLMGQGERDWRVIGVSLRSNQMAETINPQNGLYTVVTTDADGDHPEVIGSIDRVIFAGDDPADVLNAIASPETALITITVTEKGYYLDSHDHAFQLEHPDIQHDLKSPDEPTTLPGFIVAGLAIRRDQRLPPLTILSCDNLPHNGPAVKTCVLGYARDHDPALADWIENNCTFPSSMVDRIVPATTPDDIANLEALAGYLDPAMIRTEPFTQWVVEDNFAARRPPLDKVGVQFTDNVAAWENVKLRLLNGAHSAMAYLGSLAGFTYVHEVIRSTEFETYINVLWDELAATLEPIDGFDPARYRKDLQERFRNPTLQHRTRQIAIDGSQKIPPRFLTPLRARMAKRLESPAMVLAITGWMRWQFGKDEVGNAYTVDDPLAVQTHNCFASTNNDPQAATKALLGLEAIFGTDLSQNSHLTEQLQTALSDLFELGAQGIVGRFS